MIRQRTLAPPWLDLSNATFAQNLPRHSRIATNHQVSRNPLPRKHENHEATRVDRRCRDFVLSWQNDA